MTDDNLPTRALKTTTWLAALFMVIFALRGQLIITFGLGIGAALGVLSLWSLTFAIPRLFSSADPGAKFWLGMLTFCKLPIYAIVLNFAMTSRLVSSFAVFVGVAFVPAVLVLKVLGAQLLEKAETPAGDETCRSEPTLSN
jgi:hypothetical protein